MVENIGNVIKRALTPFSGFLDSNWTYPSDMIDAIDNAFPLTQ